MKIKTILQNKRTWLAAGALALVMSVSVGSALAYFTSHTEAEGRYALEIGIPDIDINESIDGLDKTISVVNNGDTECYVRVLVAYGSGTNAADVDISGEGWTQSGDYWYYAQPLAPAATTAELTAKVSAKADTPTDFDIVVVQESTPTLYEGPNNADYPGWDRTARTDIGYKEGE